MKTKKILLGAIAVILTIIISIAATVAYLTDVDSETNVFTIGNVDIDLLEYERINTETKDADANVQEFHDNKPLLPAVIDKDFDYTAGDTYVDWEQIGKEAGYTSPIWDPDKINNEVDKMVFVENTGDYSAYVRIFFAFEAGNFGTFDEFQKKIHINLNDDEKLWKWEWIPTVGENGEGKYFVATATYKKVLAPDAITEISLSQISLDYTATNDDVDAFGNDYRVLVNVQGIQSSGFSDPETALKEGFGSGVPFENFVIKGVSLYNALHYLNGNGAGTKITDNVTSITFGLNAEHAANVEGLAGVYVGEEQTTPVYAYYVPNATDNTKYDIYVLADDKICTPQNSTGLFKGMSSLQKVDTANLDVSKTEDMEDLFNRCFSLSEVDVSGWDVSNVTSLNGAFLMCSSLTKLDLSAWNVSKVTDFYKMFYQCTALTELNLSGWNLSSAIETTNVFDGCTNLNQLYVSDWDVRAVTNVTSMFNDCTNLTTLDLSGWKTESLWNTDKMFKNCSNLKTIYVGDGWDISKAQNAPTFEGCTSLVGGAGTTYSGEQANADYAIVDGTDGKPGYLTHIKDKLADPAT